MNPTPPPIDRITLITGLIGLVITALAFVINVIVVGLDGPGPNASAAEFGEFVDDNARALEIDAGQRFLVFLLFVPFIVGLTRHVAGEDERVRVLAPIALIGAAWVAATGTIANTLYSIAIFEGERLTTEPELARLLNLAQYALFSAAVLPHALIIGSFSTAGLRTKTLPTWLAVVGYLQVCTALVAAVTLARALEGRSASEAAAGLATVGFALWYLLVSGLLIAAWWRRPTPEMRRAQASP